MGIFLVSLLFAVSFVSADDKTAFEVVGTAECADCKVYNIKSSQAFSGLRVSIDCMLKNGEMQRVGDGDLDKEGIFRVSIPTELKIDCYAQIHSAHAIPCLGASKIVFKSKSNGIKTFGPNKKLQFSTTLCTSKTFVHHKYQPLPKLTHPWIKSYPKITFPPYKHYHLWPPLPPFYKNKPLPPPVPIYKPKPPVVKPSPPPIPIYKPKPPVVKSIPPPVPIYKPKPPVYKPKPPVYNKPKPPVYKPKPPVYKPKPPVYKPKPPVFKPLPPPIPIYKKPCPPLPKLPPFPKIPPKYFHHPKFGHFPPLPPHFPHH